ncbi:MAG: homoserine kinase [Rhodoferax sp.]
MAVYTEVTPAQAEALIARLGLGRVSSLRPCTGGIENTNYFVTVAQAQGERDYVLTLFERLSFDQLPFYLRLMKHLARRGIAVPEPAADAQGELVFELLGKPAAVVDKLQGSSELSPGVEHCVQVGAALARMHLAGRDFPLHQPNLRGLSWWNQTVAVVLPHLNADQAELIQSELAYQNALAASADYQVLPRGPIHADLFRDNVMFTHREGRPQLSGFFDFYFAGVDTWLFDLAVCLNDWCINHSQGSHEPVRAQAMLRAYQSVRPLQAAELRLLPALLRAGALRFWLSRLWDFYLPRQASVLKAHDPSHFERVLRQRIAHPVYVDTTVDA